VAFGIAAVMAVVIFVAANSFSYGTERFFEVFSSLLLTGSILTVASFFVGAPVFIILKHGLSGVAEREPCATLRRDGGDRQAGSVCPCAPNAAARAGSATRAARARARSQPQPRARAAHRAMPAQRFPGLVSVMAWC
jgi:hypothetical protein